MANEFEKLDYPFLEEKDFNGGELPFLFQVAAGEGANLEPIDGVIISSSIGDIFTAFATYEGLKELNEKPEVVRISYSRPGGMY